MEKALGISYKEYPSQIVPKGNYRMSRYADDFLIFAKTKEDIGKVPELLENYLNERCLILSEEKTKISHLSEGFNFLGFNFKRYKDGVSRIKPSKDSLKKFKQEVDYIFKSSNGHNVGVLIRRLNPLIRGTANYWRYAISGIEVLSKMDNYIWNKTFNFLNRLHPNKSWKWIKNKYFTSHSDGIHHSNWVLTDPVTGNTLEKMSWYNPRKYIMVKHDYSPYDSDKKDYFESRKHKFYISTR